MGKIELRDLVPPLFYRTANFIERKTAPVKIYDGVEKFHPFNHITNELNVNWVLDVGANVGEVALAALKSYPNAQVICFEPVTKTFEMLKKNVASFSNRTHLYKAALSDKEETGEINITTFHGANSIDSQAKLHKDSNPHVREIGKEKIQLVRLDDYAARFPNQRIDIMKIDVEGHELNVLRGGVHFITENVDLIIVEISLMRDHSLNNQAIFEIFALLNTMGFYLVNIMDLNHSEDLTNLAQMDCVFRNRSFNTN